jgi:hypothetical protein
MPNDVSEESFNDRFEKVVATLDADPELQDEQDEGAVTDPSAEGKAEKPIAEGQADKTSEPDKAKLEADKQPGAIEPPVSWPGDDKEAFKALPTWAQETISRRENEREAHFAERARSIAERERGLTDVQQRAAQDQQRYSQELQRLNQIATQLMPAKFSDINSEADYLRLKVEDPARASEYEAFTQVLGNAQRQAAQEQQANMNKHLAKEWDALQSKYPEFKDTAKGPVLLNEVRKACVDYYGFSPEEVQVIADHRHVPIIRDAIAWRNHQASLKSAAGKKVVQQQPTQKLRQNGAAAGANIGADEKNNILKRAAGTNDLRKKADALAALLTQ